MKTKLVIIGNGFDAWQGLPTSYSHFRQYFIEHRDEIMKRLRIKWKTFEDEDGVQHRISDVELIYGDPFQPKELDENFWNRFETSLDDINAEQLNFFFGKRRSGLRKFSKSLKNAERILREAFCNWIATIPLSNKETGFSFGDDCIFINFNYTSTLQQYFNIPEEDGIHIHGNAEDKDSIIFGHSSHPQRPILELCKFGGRFRGLFYVEKTLFVTDKHVQDNIFDLCMELAFRGINVEDIKHVYVLGHSMGLPDMEYFKFIMDSTSLATLETEKFDESDVELDSLEEFHLRMHYAVERYGYNKDVSMIDEDAVLATERQFKMEQDARNEFFHNKVFKKVFKKAVKAFNNCEGENSLEEMIMATRTEDAQWHISCYDEQDKLWAESVMTEFGCKKYDLYPTIEECLATMSET